MNERDVSELLGAYALDALPPDETAAVRAHLATCATHAAEAAELRAYADLLPHAVDATPAPTRLRGRVLDAISAEARGASTQQTPQPRDFATAGRERERSGALRGESNILLFRSRTWASIAAVLVAAIGALLVWNLVLVNGGGGTNETEFAQRITSTVPLRSPRGAGGSASVVYLGNQHKAIIVGEGIARLDDSKTYEAWAIGGQRPKSLGLVRVDADGHMTTVVPYDASPDTTIAITIEPAGGSVQPTTDPVFTTHA